MSNTKTIGLATAAQLKKARELYAAHLRSCRSLGVEPDPFHRFLQDVISSPEGTFDENKAGSAQALELRRTYEQYRAPRSDKEDA